MKMKMKRAAALALDARVKQRKTNRLFFAFMHVKHRLCTKPYVLLVRIFDLFAFIFSHENFRDSDVITVTRSKQIKITNTPTQRSRNVHFAHRSLCHRSGLFRSEEEFHPRRFVFFFLFLFLLDVR